MADVIRMFVDEMRTGDIRIKTQGNSTTQILYINSDQVDSLIGSLRAFSQKRE
ncbi:hypothetical protein RE476_00970 [Methanolobus mangrovi]|uniref:Uncharacterized protein n=1 Tax=Methanolobus mangrovi TaxID=3072977 RepID=A0AA51UFX9_9EURY|nr:hypothetical protein [Methanolobus mangrovi]WMW22420.1 hypothetical protein RE476_00970 [Methanolobus mangrovi]